MNAIVVKYSTLNKTAQQELNDFMDFLLSKQENTRINLLTAYKKKILNVGIWSDSDLKIFEENRILFNQWKIQDW